MPFQGLPHIFGVQQLTGAIPDNARFNRKSQIQDGGRQTGNTYILASRLDSNAIPAATPHYRGPATQWHYCEYCPM
jgi:hypothetical protein